MRNGIRVPRMRGSIINIIIIIILRMSVFVCKIESTRFNCSLQVPGPILHTYTADRKVSKNSRWTSRRSTTAKCICNYLFNCGILRSRILSKFGKNIIR